MKNIVVPVDFSTYSENAVDVAFQIAKSSKVILHFLHVSNKEDSEVESNLELLISKGKKYEINVEVFVDDNHRVHKGITSYAKEKNADLIIMGSHGLSPGESQFLGSNAQRVVRHSPCPVLTLKKKVKEFSINRIVYPTDLYYLQDNMFDLVLELADFFKAEIELVYINTPENFIDSSEANKKMKSFLNQHKNKITKSNIYNNHNSINGIIDFSKYIEADCIAMSTLGRSGIHRFLESSVTESIVNFSDLPVISFCSSEISTES